MPKENKKLVLMSLPVIVDKLIRDLTTTGIPSKDAEVFERVREYETLITDLIRKLGHLSMMNRRDEGCVNSEKAVGDRALRALKNLRIALNGQICPGD